MAEPASTTAPPDGAPSDEVVIRTVDLTKVYPGDVRAVHNLNLTVYKGEIFGLLGPNGAGKTTTAGMLTTRVVPTSGQAVVGGIDVWRTRPRLSLIGVVPGIARPVLSVRTSSSTAAGCPPGRPECRPARPVPLERARRRGAGPVGMAQRLMALPCTGRFFSTS
jgi:energy-coupling factor transporter ATP-binding protein EcfA2